MHYLLDWYHINVSASKSQAELMAFVPESVVQQAHMDPTNMYTQASFSAQYV